MKFLEKKSGPKIQMAVIFYISHEHSAIMNALTPKGIVIALRFKRTVAEGSHDSTRY